MAVLVACVSAANTIASSSSSSASALALRARMASASAASASQRAQYSVLFRAVAPPPSDINGGSNMVTAASTPDGSSSSSLSSSTSSFVKRNAPVPVTPPAIWLAVKFNGNVRGAEKSDERSRQRVVGISIVNANGSLKDVSKRRFTVKDLAQKLALFSAPVLSSAFDSANVVLVSWTRQMSSSNAAEPFAFLVTRTDSRQNYEVTAEANDRVYKILNKMFAIERDDD